jgi:hypothetical protein
VRSVLPWLGFLIPLISFGAISGKPGVTGRVEREVRKRAHMVDFVEHSHEALTHIHDHYHITHNKREGLDEVMGEWEHLTAHHDHAHNHPALKHSHAPHENAEHEHLGEAHVHDHEHPTESVG